jgi:2-polyprenyl-6-methoxyphenol hydroxylase-like FAD-dependent oxidoreductase
MRSPHHHIPDSGADDPRQAGSSRQPRIAVVGASLTGPAVALLLTQAGFTDVAVYEAMPASAPRGGGLLSLEHPSLDILDQLGIPRAEYVHTRSETICRAAVHRRIVAEPTRYGYPGRFTTWTQLHRALLTRLPAGIGRHRARVTALTVRHRRPLLHFADQRTAPADLVIFADGRASTGRSVLAPHRQLRYAGYVGHRGTVGFNPTNLVDFWRLEPCPGAQFVIPPVPGGVDWTFYLNALTGQYVDMFGAPPHQRLFAHPHHISPDAYRHVDGHAAWHLPELLAAAIHATTVRTAFPVMDIDSPDQMVWPIGDGHAVLLGDALAPVRAHTGRGANNGLEQAHGLVTALRQHHRHGANLGTALTGWQRRHLPAAVAAVRLGPTIGAKLGLGTTTAAAPRTATAFQQHPWVRQAAATNGR